MCLVAGIKRESELKTDRKREGKVTQNMSSQLIIQHESLKHLRSKISENNNICCSKRK